MTSSLYCKTQTVTESAKLITNLPFNVNFQLYSLLSFVSPGVFSLDAIDEFEERFTDVDDSTGERWESYNIGFSETCIPTGILVNPASQVAVNSCMPLVFSE